MNPVNVNSQASVNVSLQSEVFARVFAHLQPSAPANDAASYSAMTAFDLLCDAELARQYVASRPVDAAQLHAEIEAEFKPGCMPGTRKAHLYGGAVVLVHDLSESLLHATPCWGDVYLKGYADIGESVDPVIAHTYPQVLAFILKKFW